MAPDATTRTLARLANDLLDACDAGQAKLLRGSLDDSDLREWTYLPGARPGLSMDDMSQDQHETALALLETFGGEGADPLGARAVERFRRAMASGTDEIGADRYWFRVLDLPGRDPWGVRVNGHHLGVHAIVVGEQLTVTPHFIGSQPAVVPSGALAGHRLLGPEEDLARDLLRLLEPDRRAAAVVDTVAPADILTRFDPVADPSVLPSGLSCGDMAPAQQETLTGLVRRYLDRAPRGYADACWQQVVDAGVDNLSFAWAGPVEPGGGHYYCVTGPTLVIEYDNTQDNANHAHSVWRHLRDDWGEDLLRKHYQQHHA
jgi:Protein of unknown function (DUF3500)